MCRRLREFECLVSKLTGMAAAVKPDVSRRSLRVTERLRLVALGEHARSIAEDIGEGPSRSIYRQAPLPSSLASYPI